MPKTAKGRKRVKFALDADPGQAVYIAGSFNEWDPTSKALKDKSGKGHYEAVLMLAPGTYEYKFVVNGDWCMDPAAGDWITNELGSLNNVVTVA